MFFSQWDAVTEFILKCLLACVENGFVVPKTYLLNCRSPIVSDGISFPNLPISNNVKSWRSWKRES